MIDWKMKKMTEHLPISVLFIFDVREELKEYISKGLSDYPEIELIFPKDTKPETFLKLVPKANVIVGWRPTKELLETAKNLVLFINPGVGIQHLVNPFQELNKTREVTLVNGHGNTYFTAQHAVALLFSLTNKIIPHHNWMKEGLWRKGDADAQSTPLRDREIGLLGYGAINTKVHKFLAGFDVNFHVLKRDWNRKRVENYPTKITEYTMKELDEFLETIDILFVAIPLTKLTWGLIGERELEILGPKGLLITVARGEIIVEEALYNALKKGKIAGAAIDVWYNYRPEPDKEGRKYPANHPFYKLNNVVLSPHRAASPMNDLKRWDEVIENIRRVSFNEKPFLNEVNLEEEY